MKQPTVLTEIVLSFRGVSYEISVTCLRLRSFSSLNAIWKGTDLATPGMASFPPSVPDSVPNHY